MHTNNLELRCYGKLCKLKIRKYFEQEFFHSDLVHFPPVSVQQESRTSRYPIAILTCTRRQLFEKLHHQEVIDRRGYSELRHTVVSLYIPEHCGKYNMPSNELLVHPRPVHRGEVPALGAFDVRHRALHRRGDGAVPLHQGRVDRHLEKERGWVVRWN